MKLFALRSQSLPARFALLNHFTGKAPDVTGIVNRDILFRTLLDIFRTLTNQGDLK